MTQKKLIQDTKKSLHCDSARVKEFKPDGDKYLIIGNKRSTQDDEGQWVDESGDTLNWEYMDEKVIASAKTYKKLHEEMEYYSYLQSKYSDNHNVPFTEMLSDITQILTRKRKEYNS